MQDCHLLVHLHLLVTDHHLGSLTLVITATFECIDHAAHLSILVRQSLILLLQFPYDSLKMESVLICRVLAFSNAHKFFYFVHFGEQFLILAINEIDLTLIALDPFLSALLIEILDHASVAGLIRGDDL